MQSRDKERERKRASDKKHRHNRDLKRKYGIDKSIYDAILRAQGGRCALCRCLPQRGRRFAVDHCHTTKALRGLLCDKCNTALGLMNDDVLRLVRASAYVLAHQEGVRYLPAPVGPNKVNRQTTEGETDDPF